MFRPNYLLKGGSKSELDLHRTEATTAKASIDNQQSTSANLSKRCFFGGFRHMRLPFTLITAQGSKLDPSHLIQHGNCGIYWCQ